MGLRDHLHRDAEALPLPAGDALLQRVPDERVASVHEPELHERIVDALLALRLRQPRVEAQVGSEEERLDDAKMDVKKVVLMLLSRCSQSWSRQ